MHMGTEMAPKAQKSGCPVLSATTGAMKHEEENGVTDDDGSLTCKDCLCL